MPVYTYRCENCGVQFDKTQKFTDNSLTRCPECGKKTLRKVYQPVGIVFKGSGFYSTDNRSPSGASRPNNGHSEDKDKSASSETKSADSSSSTTSTASASTTTPTSEKSDRVEKSDKSDRAERSAKAEKAERAEKSEKKD
jgi:putative FmdB family regulatory protein